MDRILGDPRVVFDECMCIAGELCVPMGGGGASIRACSRIALFKINSAGVTPVEVFSTVFIIRCTMGSCSYDHLS